MNSRKMSMCENLGMNEILCLSGINIIFMNKCMLGKNINNEGVEYFYYVWLYNSR